MSSENIIREAFTRNYEEEAAEEDRAKINHMEKQLQILKEQGLKLPKEKINKVKLTFEDRITYTVTVTGNISGVLSSIKTLRMDKNEVSDFYETFNNVKVISFENEINSIENMITYEDYKL